MFRKFRKCIKCKNLVPIAENRKQIIKFGIRCGFCMTNIEINAIYIYATTFIFITGIFFTILLGLDYGFFIIFAVYSVFIFFDKEIITSYYPLMESKYKVY